MVLCHEDDVRRMTSACVPFPTLQWFDFYAESTQTTDEAKWPFWITSRRARCGCDVLPGDGAKSCSRTKVALSDWEKLDALASPSPSCLRQALAKPFSFRPGHGTTQPILEPSIRHSLHGSMAHWLSCETMEQLRRQQRVQLSDRSHNQRDG